MESLPRFPWNWPSISHILWPTLRPLAGYFWIWSYWGCWWFLESEEVSVWGLQWVHFHRVHAALVYAEPTDRLWSLSGEHRKSGVCTIRITDSLLWLASRISCKWALSIHPLHSHTGCYRRNTWCCPLQTLQWSSDWLQPGQRGIQGYSPAYVIWTINISPSSGVTWVSLQ